MGALPSRLDTQRELASRSLSAFIKQGWHVVEPTTPYVGGWAIEAMCEHLEASLDGHIRNLLINIPPRHMKSLAVSTFFPAFAWTRDPSLRFLCSSYAESLSVRDSVRCRRVISSPWFQERWGDRFALTGDQNAKERFENDKTGYRLATGVGGSNTGEGGDILIVDDPNNMMEIHSKAIRATTLTWWDEVMSTRLNNAKTGRRIVIMQRGHEDDVAGHILRKEARRWTHLCLPAEFEPEHRCRTFWIERKHVEQPDGTLAVLEQPKEFEDPRTEPGALLCEERFGPDEIADLKVSLGSFGSAGQLQQRPSPEAGGIFLKESWKRWTRATVPAVADFDELFQSWDCTYKGTERSDFVVGAVWGRKASDCYLLDLIRRRMTFSENLDAFAELSSRWPTVRGKLVEDAANGPALENVMRRSVPGIILVPAQGSKEERAWAIQPYQEAGNLWIPADDLFPWLPEWLREHTEFPNATNDDQVDTTSMAVLRLMLRPRIKTSRHKPEGW